MNPNSPISTIMTKKLVTVRPNTSAKEIQKLFKENTFHHLPVVDDGEKLLGIISKEDFFRVAYLLSMNTSGPTWTEKQYESLKAEAFMTKYPVNLDPDDSIGLAADIFLANKFHALPIVEDDNLVGMVTTHDLLHFSFDSPVMEEKNVQYDESN
jgi:acetoin utilization protein AcuB